MFFIQSGLRYRLILLIFRNLFQVSGEIIICSGLKSLREAFLYQKKAFLLIFFTQASFVITDFIKNFVCRERPCVYPGFSFPSGHSSTTMCFYGILIYLVLHYAKSDFWRYFLTALFGVWIFMVGISRLWLGVHFPVDVIAGMFLGFMLVNLYIIVSKSLSK